MTEDRRKILKVNESRKHKVTGSIGVYDAYKWLRKNKWLDIGRPIKEHEFYSIIRKVNDCLAYELSKGNDIILPHRMGKLELRKTKASFKIENGKVKTNLPIDWDRTLKLWSEDKEAYKAKTLVKAEETELFKVFYNRMRCNFNNCSFYEFRVNRDIKKRLKDTIKEGHIDAFVLYG